jgi:pimeloyl-ACP methyl ester carboxylesterase
MPRRRVQGDGVELSVLDEGEGRPVLMLHGFPDSSELWRLQVPALVDAGMRVIAPDLRGFGESERPADVREYRVGRSVADMVAVLGSLGVDRAAVVGHDWGAGVAWALAAFVPDRVERLVAMSVGHPDAQRERTTESREKAWYTLLFQFEGVAEELLMRDDWALFREWTRGDGDVEPAIERLARPGALTAGLNWYRASMHPRFQLRERDPVPSVRMPVLGMWSTRDHFLLEQQMMRSEAWVDGAWRYERIEDASHWLQLDRPDRVNELLLEFLG